MLSTRLWDPTHDKFSYVRETSILLLGSSYNGIIAKAIATSLNAVPPETSKQGMRASGERAPRSCTRRIVFFLSGATNHLGHLQRFVN